MKLSSSKHNKRMPIEGPVLLFRTIKENNIPKSKWLTLLSYKLKAFMVFPFWLWEYWIGSKKINDTQIQEAPIFIIGHYRSGTTFLHKILAIDTQWGRITTFDFLFPYFPLILVRTIKFLLQSIIKLLHIEHMHFHKYLVNLDDPIEEDMLTISSFSSASAFWSEILPKNASKYYNEQIFFKSEKESFSWSDSYLYILKKISRRNRGRRLLLKNPPNTGRIKYLLKLFPDAKFVLIYRNPYQVYYSTYSLWQRTLEKHYTLQDISDDERDAIIFKHYKKLMGQYLTDKELIPSQNLIEIRYEEFEKKPYVEIMKIYTSFDLPLSEETIQNIKKRLDQEKRYTKYSYDYDAKTMRKIESQWQPFIDHWQYQPLV